MAYEAFSVPGFGAGLNLRDKADAVSEEEAIDCLNVVFTERGAVQRRHGYDELNSSALTNRAASLVPHYESDGTKQLLAGCGTRLEAISTAGAIVASATGLTTGTWSFTRFGGVAAGATAEYSYAGNGKNNAQRWNGTAWSAIAAIGQPRYLAVMAVEQGNRMVIGGFDSGATGPAGATANPSRVHFSLAGAPEGVWDADDFIDFTPGDGEIVQGIIAWDSFVFIFKETKFFIVYGSSEDADGNAIFHWRTVDTGIGLASPRALCADEQGVYFMARDGVYVTSGGEPTKISGAIDPIFLGDSSDYFTGGELAHSTITNAAMGVHEDRIYLGYTAGSANDYTLVYDPTYEWWSLWDIPAAAFASFRVSSQPELVFAGASGDNDIYRINSGLTSDNGTAIESYWRSGWFDYGAPEQKTMRESKVWGSGRVAAAVSTDFSIGTGTPSDLDFTDTSPSTWSGTTWGGGTWAATVDRSPAMRRISVRGTVFSTYFYNNELDQDWSVGRLTHHLRETRIPSAL